MILQAHELPPKGTGGNTEYADTRQAFADLSTELRQELIEKDYIVHHSLFYSRKKGSPEFFKDLDPEAYPMNRHRLIQRHEPSGRMNMYIASHVSLKFKELTSLGRYSKRKKRLRQSSIQNMHKLIATIGPPY